MNHLAKSKFRLLKQAASLLVCISPALILACTISCRSTVVVPIDTAPVGAPGFRALFVYESEQGLPEVFASPDVRAYLNAKCVKGEDGTTPDWRCWDQHIDPQHDFAVWQAFWKVPRQSLPWVITGNGTTGFSGPAPTTVDELLTLLKKYGG